MPYQLQKSSSSIYRLMSDKYVLLCNAVKTGDLDTIKDLQNEGADITNRRILELGIIHGQLDFIKYICECNTGFNINNYIKIILHGAAEWGHIDIVKYVCENYADVNTDFALLCASRRAHIDIVKYLCENGDVNANDGVALRHAALHGHIEIVKCLLQNGAHINEHNSEMHFVKKNGEYSYMYIDFMIYNRKQYLLPAILDELNKFNTRIIRTKAAIKN